MAKGLEDTAFYRYNRFVALNEVGGHPDHFGVSMAAFHKANAQRADHAPHAMLGTSTHDTKRGEDVRARLAVLSEMPEEWFRLVPIWSRVLRARLGDTEASAPPDRNDEYLFYQLLLGAWPAELTGVADLDPGAVEAFRQRLEAAIIKSVRESKRNSTWAFPNTVYEEAFLGFARVALDVSRPNAFLDAFLPFQERVAQIGLSNTLVQTALKLTLPGMPDIYQGAELWDLSLVDPDNRRAVDYTLRQRLLAEITSASRRDRCEAIKEMTKDWRDGRLKLAVTATLLAARRNDPSLFADGAYEPLTAAGSRAEQVCAFARTLSDRTVLVVAARFPTRLDADPEWGETEIPQPRTPESPTRWRDLLTGATIERQGALPVADLLKALPIAVLVPDM